MRYSTSVIVALPRDAVVALLRNRDNDKLWRPDLFMCEPLFEGEPAAGAETRLLYRREGHVSEVLEILRASQLPQSQRLELVRNKGIEYQVHTFTDDDGTTQWSIEAEYKPQRTWIPSRHEGRMLADRAQHEMQAFKAFAENADARRRVRSGPPTPLGGGWPQA